MQVRTAGRECKVVALPEPARAQKPQRVRQPRPLEPRPLATVRRTGTVIRKKESCLHW